MRYLDCLLRGFEGLVKPILFLQVPSQSVQKVGACAVIACALLEERP
jgi:hypothetical protein